MCWIRKALVQRAHWVVYAPLPAIGHSRIGSMPRWRNWQTRRLQKSVFLGVRPSPGAPRLSQISEEGPTYLCGKPHGDKGAHAPVSALLRDFLAAVAQQVVADAL